MFNCEDRLVNLVRTLTTLDNLLEALICILQQVHFTRAVLGIAGVVLHDALRLQVGRNVEGNRASNNVPRNRLGTRRGCKRACVSLVQVRLKLREGYKGRWIEHTGRWCSLRYAQRGW